jgi:hypothetical protein
MAEHGETDDSDWGEDTAAITYLLTMFGAGAFIAAVAAFIL